MSLVLLVGAVGGAAAGAWEIPAMVRIYLC